MSKNHERAVRMNGSDKDVEMAVRYSKHLLRMVMFPESGYNPLKEREGLTPCPVCGHYPEWLADNDPVYFGCCGHNVYAETEVDAVLAWNHNAYARHYAEIEEWHQQIVDLFNEGVLSFDDLDEYHRPLPLANEIMTEKEAVLKKMVAAARKNSK